MYGATEIAEGGVLVWCTNKPEYKNIRRWEQPWLQAALDLVNTGAKYMTLDGRIPSTPKSSGDVFQNCLELFNDVFESISVDGSRFWKQSFVINNPDKKDKHQSYVENFRIWAREGGQIPEDAQSELISSPTEPAYERPDKDMLEEGSQSSALSSPPSDTVLNARAAQGVLNALQHPVASNRQPPKPSSPSITTGARHIHLRHDQVMAEPAKQKRRRAAQKEGNESRWDPEWHPVSKRLKTGPSSTVTTAPAPAPPSSVRRLRPSASRSNTTTGRNSYRPQHRHLDPPSKSPVPQQQQQQERRHPQNSQVQSSQVQRPQQSQPQWQSQPQPQPHHPRVPKRKLSRDADEDTSRDAQGPSPVAPKRARLADSIATTTTAVSSSQARQPLSEEQQEAYLARAVSEIKSWGDRWHANNPQHARPATSAPAPAPAPAPSPTTATPPAAGSSPRSAITIDDNEAPSSEWSSDAGEEEGGVAPAQEAASVSPGHQTPVCQEATGGGDGKPNASSPSDGSHYSPAPEWALLSSQRRARAAQPSGSPDDGDGGSSSSASPAAPQPASPRPARSSSEDDDDDDNNNDFPRPSNRVPLARPSNNTPLSALQQQHAATPDPDRAARSTLATLYALERENSARLAETGRLQRQRIGVLERQNAALCRAMFEAGGGGGWAERLDGRVVQAVREAVVEVRAAEERERALEARERALVEREEELREEEEIKDEDDEDGDGDDDEHDEYRRRSLSKSL